MVTRPSTAIRIPKTMLILVSSGKPIRTIDILAEDGFGKVLADTWSFATNAWFSNWNQVSFVATVAIAEYCFRLGSVKDN